MPVEFLTAEQESKYGKYNGDPTSEQLAKYFWLDDPDRIAVFRHRGDHNCLAFAIQLGTARYLGTFLSDFAGVPLAVVNYLSKQLRIESQDLTQYGSSKSFWTHTQEIRHMYGYSDFTDQPGHFRLTRWLYTRAWITAERPSILFDLATARCVEQKILLPGVTVMARLIAQIRDRATTRLWRKMAELPDDSQRQKLENILDADSKSRKTGLDILRQPPTKATASGLIKAIERLDRIRSLGASDWNISKIPMGRIRVLSRYASMARAQTVARMRNMTG